MEWLKHEYEIKIKELDAHYFNNIVELVESFNLLPEQQFQLLMGCASNMFCSSVTTLLNATQGMPPLSFVDTLIEKTKETIYKRLNTPLTIPTSTTTH